MTWLQWSLLSALFAAITAVFAKLGVRDLDANLATAIRTSVVVLLSWGVAGATTATIVAIVPLPQPLREWIRGET